MADARATLGRLSQTVPAPPAAVATEAFERALEDGDAFVVGPELPLRSAASLARTFGGEFARSVMELPEDRWSGPVASAFGYHLVRIRDSELGDDGFQPMEDVLNQVTMSRKHERRDAALEAALVKLRGRYDVRVESERPSPVRAASGGGDAGSDRRPDARPSSR